MFANFPELRVYFKGAQKYDADDIQKSERFKKQGQRVLLSCKGFFLKYIKYQYI